MKVAYHYCDNDNLYISKTEYYLQQNNFMSLFYGMKLLPF